MECAKCKFQFCWFCLDEFYTDYHFNHTNCPFRYCFLHSLEALLGIMAFLKLLIICEWAQSYLLTIVKIVYYALIGELFKLKVIFGIYSLDSQR